jgi:endonuclease/exonuclease/phosphatase family metal-dependent hydrolase
MQTNRQADSIRIVNLNVWFGLEPRGIFKFTEYEKPARRRLRFLHLATGLKELGPDIIAIQEANKLPGYANRLAAALDYDAVWKAANVGIKLFGLGIPYNFTAGNAVLAPRAYNLRYLGARHLSGWGLQHKYVSLHCTERRDAVAALLTIRGRRLIVFNTHTHYSLISNPKWLDVLDDMARQGEISANQKTDILNQIEDAQERREQEITRLLGFVQDSVKVHNYPYLIMGDLNTTMDSPALKNLVRELGLQDAYRIKNPTADGYTWDPSKNANTAYDGSPFRPDGVTPKEPLKKLAALFDRNEARRIDFIFLSYQFKPDMIQKAELVFTEPRDGIFVSDHFGLEVVLAGIP